MRVLTNIGIGSNLGAPQDNVREAIRRLAALGEVVARSSLYKTRAWGVIDQPDFCNAAARLATELSARDLLSRLKSIEADMGRKQTFRWGPRVIDLDILTFGDLSIAEPDLTIPHPHILERTFVLVPLAEIDARFAEARDQLINSLQAGELVPVRID